MLRKQVRKDNRERHACKWIESFNLSKFSFLSVSTNESCLSITWAEHPAWAVFVQSLKFSHFSHSYSPYFRIVNKSPIVRFIKNFQNKAPNKSVIKIATQLHINLDQGTLLFLRRDDSNLFYCWVWLAHIVSREMNIYMQLNLKHKTTGIS